MPRRRKKASASREKSFTKRIERDTLGGGKEGGRPLRGRRARSLDPAPLLRRQRRLEVCFLSWVGHKSVPKFESSVIQSMCNEIADGWGQSRGEAVEIPERETVGDVSTNLRRKIEGALGQEGESPRWPRTKVPPDEEKGAT